MLLVILVIVAILIVVILNASKKKQSEKNFSYENNSDEIIEFFNTENYEDNKNESIQKLSYLLEYRKNLLLTDEEEIE